MSDDKLTPEEEELLESVERGEWKSIQNLEKEKKRFQKAARATLKEHRVNVRLPAHVLDRIKEEAARDGIPYQTLIKSIIHKYLNGTLVRKD